MAFPLPQVRLREVVAWALVLVLAALMVFQSRRYDVALAKAEAAEKAANQALAELKQVREDRAKADQQAQVAEQQQLAVASDMQKQLDKARELAYSRQLWPTTAHVSTVGPDSQGVAPGAATAQEAAATPNTSDALAGSLPQGFPRALSGLSESFESLRICSEEGTKYLEPSRRAVLVTLQCWETGTSTESKYGQAIATAKEASTSSRSTGQTSSQSYFPIPSSTDPIFLVPADTEVRAKKAEAERDYARVQATGAEQELAQTRTALKAVQDESSAYKKAAKKSKFKRALVVVEKVALFAGGVFVGRRF